MSAAAIRVIGAVVLRSCARYRQLREAKATYDVLQQLDNRMLCDLGLSRDEIRSVAAEMAGESEHSRRLARPMFPIRPSLFEPLSQR